jgi:hypothetical protein
MTRVVPHSSRTARRPAARPGTKVPYAVIVGVLTVASTSVAVFDLCLFAAALE